MFIVYASYTELYCFRIKEWPFLLSYLAFIPNQTQRPLDSGKYNCSGGPLSSSHFRSMNTQQLQQLLCLLLGKPEHRTKWKNKGENEKDLLPNFPRPEVVFRTVSGIFVAKAFMPGREGGLNE